MILHSHATKLRIIELVEKGRLPEARSMLEQLVYSDDADLGTLRAMVSLLSGDVSAAEAELHLVLGREAGDTHASAMLACLSSRKQHAACLEALSIGGRADTERRQWVDVADPERRRLAVVCGPSHSFVAPLAAALNKTFEVRTVFLNTSLDLALVQQALDWADVAWFEWCDQVLIHASKRLKKTARIVCRLHSFEAFTEMPSQVDWSFVDHVVFVAPHIRRIVMDEFDLPVDHSVVRNGVDVERMPFVNRERGFNVAYLGYVNFKKNPELLLQVAAKLVKTDSRYQVHVAGTFQEPRYQLYFEKMIPEMGLTRHVHLHGWIEDVDAWLTDKHYIISTSVLEGCPLNLIEAMAKGLKPVIHNWVGADELYPRAFLFNTVDEAVTLIRSDSYDSGSYRTFVERHFPFKRQVEETAAILNELAVEARVEAT